VKFTGTIARRMVSPTGWRGSRALVATQETLDVFPLDGDALGAAQAREDLERLLSTMSPTEVLAYLYDRNSTVTTYSEPRKVSAGNPGLAAAKLYESEA